MLAALVFLLATEGRPLHYWGAQPPVISVAHGVDGGEAAQLTDLHAAADRGALVLRFSFDRAVRDAIQLPDGTPVSGRLSATLYLDADDNRATGIDQGPGDLRTGADFKLELGVVSVGADPDEHRPAQALVTVALFRLARDGRRHALWRTDDAASPAAVSPHGEWVEVRIPPQHLAPARMRLILALGDGARDGRFAP